MHRLLVKFALHLHSFSYKLASRFAIITEDGSHPKHRLTRYHDFFVDHITQEDVVLDIGCGNGALTFDMAKKAKWVVGIDINEKNRQSWEKKYCARNLTFLVADATYYQPGQTFNVVVLSNVLEHIDARAEFLKKIKHLAPTFLIRVPMINRDWITIYKKELGLEYRLDTTHFVEYTMEGFIDELTRAGLAITYSSVQFGEIWAVVANKK